MYVIDFIHNLLSDWFLMQFELFVGVIQIIISAAWCATVKGLLCAFLG